MTGSSIPTFTFARLGKLAVKIEIEGCSRTRHCVEYKLQTLQYYSTVYDIVFIEVELWDLEKRNIQVPSKCCYI